MLLFMSSLAKIRAEASDFFPKGMPSSGNGDAQDIEESPEFLAAALDKGIWSRENEPKSSFPEIQFMKRLREARQCSNLLRSQATGD